MELLEVSLGKLKKEKIWIELYKLRIVFLSDIVVAGTPLEDVGQAWPRMYMEMLLITGIIITRMIDNSSKDTCLWTGAVNKLLKPIQNCTLFTCQLSGGKIIASILLYLQYKYGGGVKLI